MWNFEKSKCKESSKGRGLLIPDIDPSRWNVAWLFRYFNQPSARVMQRNVFYVTG